MPTPLASMHQLRLSQSPALYRYGTQPKSLMFTLPQQPLSDRACLTIHCKGSNSVLVWSLGLGYGSYLPRVSDRLVSRISAYTPALICYRSPQA